MSKKSKGIDRLTKLKGAGSLAKGKNDASSFKTDVSELNRSKEKSNRRKKDIENVKLKNNYFKNVRKSVSYAMKDILKNDLMPNTYDAADGIKNQVKYVQDNFKNMNQSIKAFDGKIKGSQAYKQGQSALSNAMKDIKSGKIYNKERADKFNSEFSESYGDDIFDEPDFGEGNDDDFFSDGGSDDDMFEAVGGAENVGLDDFDETDAGKFDVNSFNTKSGNKVYVDNRKSIKVQKKYSTPDNSGELDVNLTRLTMENDNRNTSVIGDLFNRHTAQTVDGLESINGNVAQLIDYANGTINPFIETTTQFYEDNINSLKGINETLSQTFELVKTLGINQEEARMDAFESDASKAFGAGFDKDAYKEILKKNINEMAMNSGLGDLNSLAELVQEFIKTGGGIGEIAANPLGQGLKFGLKKLMGNSAQANLQDIDKIVGDLPRLFNNKMIKWSFAKEGTMENILGNLFGAKAKTKSNFSVRRSESELKQASAWTVHDHKALTVVIPKYLAEISKNTSGGKQTEERYYDYTNGTWKTKSQTKKDVLETQRKELANEASESSNMFSNDIRQQMAKKKGTNGEPLYSAKELAQIAKNSRELMENFLILSANFNLPLDDALTSLTTVRNKNLYNQFSALLGGKDNLKQVIDYLNIIKETNPRDYKNFENNVFSIMGKFASSSDKFIKNLDVNGGALAFNSQEELNNTNLNAVNKSKKQSAIPNSIDMNGLRADKIHKNSNDKFLQSRASMLESQVASTEKLLKKTEEDKDKKIKELQEKIKKEKNESKIKSLQAQIDSEEKTFKKYKEKTDKQLKKDREALEAAKNNEYVSNESNPIARGIDYISHVVKEEGENLIYGENVTNSYETNKLANEYKKKGYDGAANKAINNETKKEKRYKYTNDEETVINELVNYGFKDRRTLQKMIDDAEAKDREDAIKSKDPELYNKHQNRSAVINYLNKQRKKYIENRFADGGSKTVVSRGHRPPKKGERTVTALVGEGRGKKIADTAEIVTAHTDEDTGNAVLNVYKPEDTKRMLKGKKPKNKFADGGSAVVEKGRNAVNTVTNFMKDLGSTISTAISNPLEAIKEGFGKLFDKFTSFLSSIEEKIKQSDLYQKIMGKFKNRAKKAGKNIKDESVKSLDKITNGMITKFKEDKKENGLGATIKNLINDKIGKPLGNFARNIFGDENIDKGKGIMDKVKGFLGAENISGKDVAFDAGLGVLGSFFLPGGPIIGALVGMGTGLTLRSKKFQKFLFGEGVDDEDKNGLQKVASKMKGLVKDNKSVIAGGVLGSLFLPGGPIMGALLGGFGTKFVRDNQDRVKTLLFGKIDKDGNGKLGIVNKSLMQIQKNLVNPFAKLGLKLTKQATKILDKSLLRPLSNTANWFKAYKKYLDDKIKERSKRFGKRLTNLGQRAIEGLKGVKDFVLGKIKKGIVGTFLKKIRNKVIGEKDKETGKRHGGVFSGALNFVSDHRPKPLKNLTETLEREYGYKKADKKKPSELAKKINGLADKGIEKINDSTAKINEQLSIHVQNRHAEIEMEKQFFAVTEQLQNDLNKKIDKIIKNSEGKFDKEQGSNYKDKDGNFREDVRRYKTDKELIDAYNSTVLRDKNKVDKIDSDDKHFKKWKEKNEFLNASEVKKQYEDAKRRYVANDEKAQENMTNARHAAQMKKTMAAYNQSYLTTHRDANGKKVLKIVHSVANVDKNGKTKGMRIAQNKVEDESSEAIQGVIADATTGKRNTNANSRILRQSNANKQKRQFDRIGKANSEDILELLKSSSDSNEKNTAIQEATKTIQEKSSSLLESIEGKLNSIIDKINNTNKPKLISEDKDEVTAASNGGSLLAFASGGSVELNADGKAGDSYVDQMAEDQANAEIDRDTRQTNALESIASSLGGKAKKGASIIDSFSKLFPFLGTFIGLFKSVFKGIKTIVKGVAKIPKLIGKIWSGIKAIPKKLSDLKNTITSIPTKFKNLKDKIKDKGSEIKKIVTDKDYRKQRREEKKLAKAERKDTTTEAVDYDKVKLSIDEIKAMKALQNDADNLGLSGPERAIYISNGMANIQKGTDVLDKTKNKNKPKNEKDDTKAQIEKEKLATEKAVNKEEISSAKQAGKTKRQTAKANAKAEKKATKVATEQVKNDSREAGRMKKQTATEISALDKESSATERATSKAATDFESVTKKTEAMREQTADAVADTKANAIKISTEGKKSKLAIAAQKIRDTVSGIVEKIKSAIGIAGEGAEATAKVSGALPFGLGIPAAAAAIAAGVALIGGLIKSKTSEATKAGDDGLAKIKKGDTKGDVNGGKDEDSSKALEKVSKKTKTKKDSKSKSAVDKAKNDQKKRNKEILAEKKKELKKRAANGDKDAKKQLKALEKQEGKSDSSTDSETTATDKISSESTKFNAKNLAQRIVNKDEDAKEEYKSMINDFKKNEHSMSKKERAKKLKQIMDVNKEITSLNRKKALDKVKSVAKKGLSIGKKIFKYTPLGMGINTTKKVFSVGKKVVGAVGKGVGKVGKGLWNGAKSLVGGIGKGIGAVGKGALSLGKKAFKFTPLGMGINAGKKLFGFGKSLLKKGAKALSKGSTAWFLSKILKKVKGIHNMIGRKFGYIKKSAKLQTGMNSTSTNGEERPRTPMELLVSNVSSIRRILLSKFGLNESDFPLEFNDNKGGAVGKVQNSMNNEQMTELKRRADAGDKDAQAQLAKMQANNENKSSDSKTGNEKDGKKTGLIDGAKTLLSKLADSKNKPKKFSNETITATLNGRIEGVDTKSISKDAQAIVNAIIQTNQILIKGLQLDSVVAEGSDVSMASKSGGIFGSIAKAIGFGKGDGEEKPKYKSEREEDIPNAGVPYYSQSDPRWATNGYGADDMETDGCGPTAMAMVASKMTNKNISPDEMAVLANVTGTVDERGTSYEFIDRASDDLGLKKSKSVNPSSTDLKKSLRNGPVILAGNSSSENGAFTKAGHYLVATGVDNTGKVIVQDPRGEDYNGTFDASDLARQTKLSWNYGSDSDETKETGKIYGFAGDNKKKKKKKNEENLTGDSKIDKAVQWAVDIANDESHGYNQSARNGPDYDCSSLVSMALNKGGFNIKPGQSTATLQEALAKDTAEFKDVTSETNGGGTNFQKMQKGDVQVTPKHHTEMYVGGGKNVAAHIDENGNISGGKTGDQTGNEISVAKPFETYKYVYRPKGKYTEGYSTNSGSSSSGGSSSSSSSSSGSSSSGGSSSSSDSKNSSSNFMSDFISSLTGFASEMFTGTNTYEKAKEDNEEFEKAISGGSSSDSSSGDYSNDDSSDYGTDETASDYSSGSASLSANSSTDDILKMDWTQIPKLTKGDVKKILKRRLKGKDSKINIKKHTEGIYKAQKASNISDLLSLAIATQESGLGISSIAKSKNNFWGWGAINSNPYGGAKAFSTVPKAFKTYGKALKKTYYDGYGVHNLNDVDTVKGYAYNDDGTISKDWNDNVASIMKGYLGYGLQLEGDSGVGDASGKAGKTGGGSVESNKKYIWNYFKKKGAKDKAIAAIMGNIQSESGFHPDRKQGDIPYSDTSKNYSDSIDSGSLSRDKFAHDSIGFGFPQYTYYTRKEALYDKAKKDNVKIGSLAFQTKYLYDDVSKYNSVKSLMKSGKGSIQSMTSKVMTDYERPADQSQSAQKKRGDQAKKIYNQFHGKGEGKKYSPKLPKIPTGWGKGEGSTTVHLSTESQQPTINVEKYDYFKDTSTRINKAINASSLSNKTNMEFDLILKYLETIAENTGGTNEGINKLLETGITAEVNIDNSKIEANNVNPDDKSVKIIGGDSNIFTGGLDYSNQPSNSSDANLLNKINLIAQGN